jgi:hypothetical protein
MTSVDYVKAAIATVEESLKGTVWKIPTNAPTPMVTSYLPELDVTEELDAQGVQKYQEMIGMLRWATEIGRVDILLEIALLSQYQASPRQGHMEQLLRIFGFMKKNPKLTLYFNPELPNYDFGQFSDNRKEFLELYRDAKEDLPHDLPKPRGVPVVTTAFVDASHAANKKTRKSHTGFLIFVNRAPIVWYSKRQQTVESSTYASEYIAMKVCIESIQHLRYKLRMFGVPLDGETNVWCDNEAVCKSSTNVESVLTKKHNSIAYHYTRWAVAAGMVRIAWIPTDMNLADSFTKRLAQVVRERLFGDWTY